MRRGISLTTAVACAAPAASAPAVAGSPVLRWALLGAGVLAFLFTLTPTRRERALI